MPDDLRADLDGRDRLERAGRLHTTSTTSPRVICAVVTVGSGVPLAHVVRAAAAADRRQDDDDENQLFHVCV